MSLASQGHKPLVSPNIEQKYNKLRQAARDLMGLPFDLWNLPILLNAFIYEYGIHHAFEIPKESALTEEMDAAAEGLKKLFQEQQHYIKTASEEGKLMAEKDGDGNLRIRIPLLAEYEDDVATTLKNYAARRERLESRFTDAYRELQTYRDTVRKELKQVGDQYSDYFNKAPEVLHNLISKVEDEGRRQGNILIDFRDLILRQFPEYNATDIKLVNDIRHQYLKVLLPMACGTAMFTGSGSYDEPAQERAYWRTEDWSPINTKLTEYDKQFDEKIKELVQGKTYTEIEMEGYSAYISVVDAKFQILDQIYKVIPPDVIRGRSFDFNELSVAGAVTTSEQNWFQNRIKTLRNNLGQRKGVLKHIVDVEYRRLFDSINGLRYNVPRALGNQGDGGTVFYRGLAAACCRDYWDDCE